MRYWLLLVLSFFSQLNYADTLIVEPDMGRAPIVDSIASAHSSIALVMYGFTDKQILKVLLKQHAADKTLQMIVEGKPYKAEKENNKVIALLNASHIPLHMSIPHVRLIHQKTLLLDGKQAIVMTFNFTYTTFKKERNFALVITDPVMIKNINDTFQADWAGKPAPSSIAKVIWSPGSREKILAFIDGTQHTLDIYAQDVNDYEIVGDLAKAARRGVLVRIVTSNALKKKEETYLAKAGVKVIVAKRYVIHAKVLISDTQRAMIGSINLTKASLEDNRELSVVTEDGKVVERLEEVFRRDSISR